MVVRGVLARNWQKNLIEKIHFREISFFFSFLIFPALGSQVLWLQAYDSMQVGDNTLTLKFICDYYKLYFEDVVLPVWTHHDQRDTEAGFTYAYITLH